MRILHLADRFGWCDGCARHVLLLLREQRGAHEVRIVLGAGDAAQQLREEGVPFEIRRSILHEARSAAGFVRGAMEAGRAIRAFSPDVIHAHHFYAANLVRWNPANRRRPLVLTVHGNVKEYGKLPHYLGDRIIAVSRSTERRIRARRPSVAPRVRYLPNAAAFLDRHALELRERKEWREIAALKESRLVLLFVGRFSRMKGFDLLLEAAARLALRRPLVLVAVGGQDGVEAFRVPPALRILRVSDIPDVLPFYELADIVLLPSLSEGLPLSILEAGLAGKCVVASDVDGIPEIVRHEETGLLVPPGDAEALHEALERAAGDPALRVRLGANLGELVRREHDVGRMAERVEAVYAELLPKGRGRREA